MLQHNFAFTLKSRGLAVIAGMLISFNVANAQSTGSAVRMGHNQVDHTAGPDADKYQVMPRQMAFEAHQKGYQSKIQGAASQNVVWVDMAAQRRHPQKGMFYRFRNWLSAIGTSE